MKVAIPVTFGAGYRLTVLLGAGGEKDIFLLELWKKKNR